MKERKYIIRYKMGDWKQWYYSTGIGDDSSFSTDYELDKDITKMTLEEAEKNLIKIKKIRRSRSNKIKKIQIIEAETNRIIKERSGEESEEEPKEVSRFELMEL